MDKEYETGLIVGENKGCSDGKLLVEPYPYIDSNSISYKNGYKVGYLKGYINGAKEKEQGANKELLKLINLKLKTISDIVLQKDNNKQSHTFRK